jgi:hypothetical protein
VAVDDAGTAIFGGTNGKVHFIGSDGVAKRTPVVVGTGALRAPVVVGSAGVWVPSDDGKVYLVPTDTAAVVETACDTGTGGAVTGVALGSTGTFLAASFSGAYFTPQGSVCRNSLFFLGAVLFQPVATGATYYGAEGNNLHALTLNTFGSPGDSWSSPASLGAPVAAPMAVGSAGAIVVAVNPAAGGNSLFSVSTAGVVTPIAATNSLASDGPAINAAGEILVPETVTKTLSSWSSAGALRWHSAALPGVPLTPMLLDGDDAIVVADGHGNLTALDASGAIRWTTQLAPAATPLHPPNLFAPPGAAHSTGYIPASNGTLHAVILDGRLDPAAPWPKAFHDPKNTGNSATPQPAP